MIAELDSSQTADLPAIETPVLLLVGTEESFSEQARASTELLPNGTYVLIQGLDHVQMFCPKRPCRTACPGVFSL
jgi:pimeloyl-ACP methyl ester carboxylesterase